MHYIVFGCGVTGSIAFGFLGAQRVAFLASNDYLDPEGNEIVKWGKKVISFERMAELSKTGDYIIVVASEKYAQEMGKQLRDAGIVRFFVFHENDIHEIMSVYPGYFLNQAWEVRTYNKALSYYRVDRYKKIAIYGDNYFLPYLISELAFQCDFGSIVGVVQTSDVPHARSMGVPLVTLDEVVDDIDCLIINMRRGENPIHYFLDEHERRFDAVDIYDLEKFESAFYHPELAKYKGIHKGKRIFIIGNGPSLRIEDLNKLHEHGELCFGFNQVVRAYDRTEWRADYLGITDLIILKDIWELIPDINSPIFFVETEFNDSKKWNAKNFERIHMVYDNPYPSKPNFSDDICKCVYSGYTSIYNLGFQIASYMGISDIYLLGVDNSFTSKKSDAANHFIKDYFKNEETKKEIDTWTVVTTEKIERAFEKAESYSRTHGFRIYNATRGGKLEAFERVDFDSLFED